MKWPTIPRGANRPRRPDGTGAPYVRHMRRSGRACALEQRAGTAAAGHARHRAGSAGTHGPEAQTHCAPPPPAERRRAGRGGLGVGRAAGARAERARMVRMLNRIARTRNVQISDWQGCAYLVAGATGRQELVPSLAQVWLALDRLGGAAIDPLEHGWLSRPPVDGGLNRPPAGAGVPEPETGGGG